jgi:hypothetical protein
MERLDMIDAEERRSSFLEIERKRLEVGDCLFSSQRHTHRLNNARKLVKLASELAELVALFERDA